MPRGRIFQQLWHVGRISHPSLLPNDALPVAPSAIKPAGKAFTHHGMTNFVTPRALETSEIPALIEDFRMAALRAKTAGFDGVEVHGANGYLLDQFLRDGSNHRTDQYGGPIANRTRLLQEVVAAVCEVWSVDRVGVRISPLNQYNDMRDSNPQALFNHVGIRFVHSVWPICTWWSVTCTAQVAARLPRVAASFQWALHGERRLRQATRQRGNRGQSSRLRRLRQTYIANPDLVNAMPGCAAQRGEPQHVLRGARTGLHGLSGPDRRPVAPLR
jgi:2,4-dienoyl-CoA reductase-like NADH-dependent reductase (Old Yellow Enzyme family)